MYRYKKDVNINKYLNGRSITSICEQIGKAQPYISKVMNNKFNCSKTVAFAFTKAINKNLLIEEFFEKVD